MFGFLRKNKSASIAKDRLTIAIMSDRANNNEYSFIEAMKADIVEVVRKYAGVKAVEVRKEVDGNLEAISIDVELDIKKK